MLVETLTQACPRPGSAKPVFAATFKLRGALSAETDSEDRNILLSKRLPGGSLKVVVARAPRDLHRQRHRDTNGV